MRFAAIAAGGNHSLALKSDGTVVGWGAYLPPAGLSNVVKVVAGYSHSLALRNDGGVIVWGNDAYGKLVVPANVADVIDIAAGADFCVALVSTPLRIHSIEVLGQGATLTFPTSSGQGYQVEFSSNPAEATWSNLPAGTVVGDGLDAVVTDTNLIGVLQRFYRVRQLP